MDLHKLLDKSTSFERSTRNVHLLKSVWPGAQMPLVGSDASVLRCHVCWQLWAGGSARRSGEPLGPGHPEGPGDPGPGRRDPQRRPSGAAGRSQGEAQGASEASCHPPRGSGLSPAREDRRSRSWLDTEVTRGALKPSAGAAPTCAAATPSPRERPR